MRCLREACMGDASTRFTHDLTKRMAFSDRSGTKTTNNERPPRLSGTSIGRQRTGSRATVARSITGTVLTLVVAVGTAGCSTTAGASNAKHDGLGDPYITDAQGRSIRVGASATAVFRALGGIAESGYNGDQAVPPLTYDYPIRGTGKPR
jgi:hypothetical protein